MTPGVLPTAGWGPNLTAALNAISMCFLLAGWWAIRHRRLAAHRRAMLAALTASALFLAVYLTHHYLSGSTRYPFQDWTRTLYLWILVPHTILATAILPFVLRGVWLAWRAHFTAHARLMRRVWPLWLYVSASGIAVYVMLYHYPHWR